MSVLYSSELSLNDEVHQLQWDIDENINCLHVFFKHPKMCL
jgi:hypothetical protein